MDMKDIGVIVAIVIGVGGPVGSYFVTTTHTSDVLVHLQADLTNARSEAKEAVAAVRAEAATTKTDLRQELNGMHSREQTLADGLVGARNDVSLARSEIAGKLDLMNANLQHVKDAVDEVRGAQKKHPGSLDAAATSQ